MRTDRLATLAVSGQRTHAAMAGSVLEVVPGAPHGFNLSHADEFNRRLLAFLQAR